MRAGSRAGLRPSAGFGDAARSRPLPRVCGIRACPTAGPAAGATLRSRGGSPSVSGRRPTPWRRSGPSSARFPGPVLRAVCSRPQSWPSGNRPGIAVRGSGPGAGQASVRQTAPGGRFRVRRDRADRPVRIRGTGADGARHSRAGEVMERGPALTAGRSRRPSCGRVISGRLRRWSGRTPGRGPASVRRAELGECARSMCARSICACSKFARPDARTRMRALARALHSPVGFPADS